MYKIYVQHISISHDYARQRKKLIFIKNFIEPSPLHVKQITRMKRNKDETNQY